MVNKNQTFHVQDRVNSTPRERNNSFTNWEPGKLVSHCKVQMDGVGEEIQISE